MSCVAAYYWRRSKSALHLRFKKGSEGSSCSRPMDHSIASVRPCRNVPSNAEMLVAFHGNPLAQRA